MDLLDYAVTWGNVGILNYYHAAFGWAYVAIKLCVYLLLAAWGAWVLINKFKYKYAVDIEVVGSNNTISEFHDFAKYVDHGTKIRLKRRRTTIPAPDKRYITYVTGKYFVKGKIRLYQYGETEYSYTPIETTIVEDNQIKFKAIDPKLSMLESLNKSSRDKFADKKNMIIQYAPLIIGLSFVAACFIMLIFAIEQVKPLLGSAGSLLNQASEILAKSNAAQVVTNNAGVLY